MKRTRKLLLAAFTAALMVFIALFAAACGGKKAVKGIEIAEPPTKTDYVLGQTFDPAGMTVNLVYEDGTVKALEAKDYTYAPEGALALNTSKITVTYVDGETTYTATQAIRVHNRVVSAEIKKMPDKTAYLTGETFDPTGMVVTATYENGDTKDVDITADNANYKTDPLTEADVSVVVTFSGIQLEVAIEIRPGVFIEAENGIVETNSTQWRRTDADSSVPAEYQASGYAYVGDLKTGDSISFVFDSDKAGTGDIAFRMASQYLKEDDNWTPIWMGDCQFNKICTFSVNDVEYDIPDSAVLPGGGESGGEPNPYLWMNWQEVKFENISFREGRNEIKLTFIAHDYTDVSQADYAGKFTANIDCLVVTSEECRVTPNLSAIEAYSGTAATLTLSGGAPCLVVTGTVTHTFTDLSEAAAALNTLIGFEIQENGGSWQYVLSSKNDRVVTVDEDGTFTLTIDLSTLAVGQYITHMGPESNPDTGHFADFKLGGDAAPNGLNVSANGKKYTLISENDDYFGCVGILVENVEAE